MVFHSILRIFVCHFDIKQWFCMEIYPLEFHEVSITLCQTSMLAIFWWPLKKSYEFCFLPSFQILQMCGHQNPRGSYVLGAKMTRWLQFRIGPFKGAAQLLGVDPGPVSTDGQVLNSAGRYSGFQKPMVSRFLLTQRWANDTPWCHCYRFITYRSYSLEGIVWKAKLSVSCICLIHLRLQSWKKPVRHSEFTQRRSNLHSCNRAILDLIPRPSSIEASGKNVTGGKNSCWVVSFFRCLFGWMMMNHIEFT